MLGLSPLVARMLAVTILAALVIGCAAPAPPTPAPPTPAAATPAAAPTASSAPTSASVTLTLYNAQHENLTKAMVEGFTQETGIKVNLRSGKDFELANQIVQEGAASPADAFITENSPAMLVVDKAGLFAPVDRATLEQVPSNFSPSTGTWVGVAARATALVYNPSLLPADDLPASILDVGGSKWRGKVGFAPGGADFQAIVSAVLATRGEQATAEWLRGLKANGQVYQGNGAVMKAVNAGEIPAGIIYHYYWYKDRAESGANSKNTELYFFPNRDPGGFVSVSGLGALKSSQHPKEAQALLRYLTGPKGQEILAKSNALEYTVNSSVPANPILRPLATLSMPDVEIASLNGPKVIELMQQAGLL